ncbi:MAG: hypothetical protein SGPRY_007146 [Prymnesium sp.]
MKRDDVKKRALLLKANLELQSTCIFSVSGAGNKHLKVSPETGVYEFCVNVKACEQLLEFVTDKKNRNEMGILSYKNKLMPGFGDYDFGEEEKHHKKLQETQYSSILHGLYRTVRSSLERVD